MNKFDFTAIDFETAQGKRWSACEIGIVEVMGGKKVSEFHSLIQPPGNVYHQANTLVHGLNAELTKDALTFDSLWPEIELYIKKRLLVAHNAPFDIDVLSQTLQYYKLKVPKFKFKCTYSIFISPLSSICQAYNIQFTHHNALSDAHACADIYLKYLNGIEPDPLLFTDEGRKYLFDFKGHEAIRGDVLRPDFENADSNSPFLKKKVVITGVFHYLSREEIACRLKELGADVDVGITKKTNFLIKGESPGPSKIRKVEDFISNGIKIRILDEKEFLDISGVFK